MKRKIIALLLCIVCVVSLCFPVAADDDGYSAIVSDIDKTCPTCGATLHASWGSTSGAEVELEISDTGKVKIPAGAGAFARIHLRCSSCGYEKTETRLLGLDFGAEKPGKLVQAPSGIGRKDLPGYNDDNGTPTIGADGFPTLTFKMSLNGFATNFGGTFLYGSPLGSYSNGTFSVSSTYNFTGFYATDNATAYPRGCVSHYFVAPYTGYYQVTDASCSVKIVSKDNGGYDFPNDNYASLVHVSAPFTGSNPSFPSRFYDFMENGVSKNWRSNKVYIVKGNRYYLNFYLESYYSLSDSMSGHPAYYSVSINFPAPTITVTDIGSIATINKQTNITINNDYSQTWNGNIYTDNSTNLTYIYPQYTTINEKNETVTNISNNPIIYNSETKQYYTYDQTTKNYYYINYEAAPTPTPAPTETPTPSPEPTEEPSPSPTPTPGGSGTGGSGDVSTPETGKPGNSSGSSWWDKLLSKIGDAIIDGLLGAVSAVLKLIFKLFSAILSWIIWAVSRVFDLLPFLPPGLGGLLVGGVVVCFVIGIIKFIRG